MLFAYRNKNPRRGFPIVSLRITVSVVVHNSAKWGKKLWSRLIEPGEDLEQGEGSRPALKSGQWHDQGSAYEILSSMTQV